MFGSRNELAAVVSIIVLAGIMVGLGGRYAAHHRPHHQPAAQTIQ